MPQKFRGIIASQEANVAVSTCLETHLTHLYCSPQGNASRSVIKTIKIITDRNMEWVQNEDCHGFPSLFFCSLLSPLCSPKECLAVVKVKASRTLMH